MKDARRNSIRVSAPRHVKLSQRYWWLLIQGICALIFGVLAVGAPQVTIFLFIRLFGIYALVDGLVALGSVLFSRWHTHTHVRGQWMVLAEGGVGVIAGLFFLALPRVQTNVLVYTIAVWLLVKGISFATQVRQRGWIMGISGLLAFLTGVYLFISPASGLSYVLKVVGIFALIVGVLLIIRALRAWRAQATPALSEPV